MFLKIVFDPADKFANMRIEKGYNTVALIIYNVDS